MSPTSGDQLLRYRQPPGSEPGETETIIGNWFASGGGQREQTVIATKVYGEMGGWPNEGKLSALNIRWVLDASLRRRRDHPLVTAAGRPARWGDQEGEHRGAATRAPGGAELRKT
jgi:aryl-alcohol dehydrogenase-like predicted oxidoreductase